MALVYEQRATTESTLVGGFCDACGEDLADPTTSLLNFARVSALWGYSSRRDGDDWGYALCEVCAEKAVRAVGIQV